MAPAGLLEALIEVGAVGLENVFLFERTTNEGVDGIADEGEDDGKGWPELSRLGAIQKGDGDTSPQDGAAHIAHKDFGGRPIPIEETEEGGNEEPPEGLMEVKGEESELEGGEAGDEAVEAIHEVVEVDQGGEGDEGEGNGDDQDGNLGEAGEG